MKWRLSALWFDDEERQDTTGVKSNSYSISCGLMMKKDKIQLTHRNMPGDKCCGLMMKKDKIQQGKMRNL